MFKNLITKNLHFAFNFYNFVPMKFAIRYNHIGYTPQASKEFLLVSSESKDAPNRFNIVTADGELAYSGSLIAKGFCDYSGEYVWSGDFSELTAQGDYKIKVADIESRPFAISSQWVTKQLASTLKSFYYQRSGVELTKERAGKWAREAHHLDDCIEFHPCMEREGTWNAHGGWYDAGDYGKYIVNGGISVATLLLAAEFSNDRPKVIDNETSFDNDSFHATLLEELRFELDFFLRMQDHDGGAFFKISPVRWDPFVTPAESEANQKRRVLGKSTTSSLNFAGALAQAHNVYKNSDPEFAKTCLDASIRAYNWAKANPDLPYPNNTEGSGPYADLVFKDEFFWARAMLYRELGATCKATNKATGNATYSALDIAELHENLLNDMQENPPKLGLDWRDTQNLGWIALAMQNHNMELQSKAREALKATADEVVKLCNEDPYAIAIRSFVWGSNGDVANHALTLLLVNSWFPKAEYKATAEHLMDFIYGKNPVNTCFVTGAAWSSPKFPHHRICHTDGIDEPIPGLVAGGINSDRQDLRRNPPPHYSSDLPGLSYADQQSSFASNETAINWNAPLVAALSLL